MLHFGDDVVSDFVAGPGIFMLNRSRGRLRSKCLHGRPAILHAIQCSKPTPCPPSVRGSNACCSNVDIKIRMGDATYRIVVCFNGIQISGMALDLPRNYDFLVSKLGSGSQDSTRRCKNDASDSGLKTDSALLRKKPGLYHRGCFGAGTGLGATRQFSRGKRVSAPAVFRFAIRQGLVHCWLFSPPKIFPEFTIFSYRLPTIWTGHQPTQQNTVGSVEMSSKRSQPCPDRRD